MDLRRGRDARRLFLMWTKFAKLAVIAAGAFSLSGCVLSSSIPFVPSGEAPADIEPGTYQFHMATEREQVATLSKEAQAACIDPGSFQPPDDETGKNKERIHYAYCANDPDREGELRQRIVIRHTAGRLEMQGDKLPGEVPTMLVAPGIYLAQLDQRPVAGRAKYDYHLMRPGTAAIDIFPLYCGLFKSLPETDDGTCEAKSLASVRSEIDAAVAKIGTGEMVPTAKLVPLK